MRMRSPTFVTCSGGARRALRAIAAALGWAGSALVLLCAACAQPAGSHATDWRVAAAPVLADWLPPHELGYANGARVRGDVVYAILPGYRPLTLDLYMPPEGARTPARGFPLIVFVHGGAWAGGHARHAGAIDGFPGYLARLSEQGYVVASVNYRLSGEAQFPAALLDLKLAVRWLRAQSAELDLDRNNAVLWGASAGGQVAALAALACEADQFDLGPTLDRARTPELVDESDCVQALALWYAPSDFMIMRQGADGAARDTPEALYLGCALAACEDELLHAASPVHFVDASDPPVLLVHGAGDVVVPFAHAAELASRLHEVGARVQIVSLDGVGHSFIGATPEQTRDSTLLALTRTESFFAEMTCRDCERARHDN